MKDQHYYHLNRIRDQVNQANGQDLGCYLHPLADLIISFKKANFGIEEQKVFYKNAQEIINTAFQYLLDEEFSHESRWMFLNQLTSLFFSKVANTFRNDEAWMKTFANYSLKMFSGLSDETILYFFSQNTLLGVFLITNAFRKSKDFLNLIKPAVNEKLYNTSLEEKDFSKSLSSIVNAYRNDEQALEHFYPVVNNWINWTKENIEQVVHTQGFTENLSQIVNAYRNDEQRLKDLIPLVNRWINWTNQHIGQVVHTQGFTENFS